MKARVKGKKTVSQIKDEENLVNNTILLCVWAMNREFGIGKNRLHRFYSMLNECTAHYHDWMKSDYSELYASWKLADIISNITGEEYIAVNNDEGK